MPCRDYEETPREFQSRIDTAQNRADELTALLCIACNELLDSGELPEELETWYSKHRAADLNNMDELICFASDMAPKLCKEDFDALDKFLTNLRDKF